MQSSILLWNSSLLNLYLSSPALPDSQRSLATQFGYPSFADTLGLFHGNGDRIGPQLYH